MVRPLLRHKLTLTWMLPREGFFSIVFKLTGVRRFAGAKPPYDLRTLLAFTKYRQLHNV